MKYFQFAIQSICLIFSILYAEEITVCSYNCGGLPNHYDYLRSACMQKLMQERANEEPELMALNEKVQKLALKLRFAPASPERMIAQQEWDQMGYQHIFECLTASHTNIDGPSVKWRQKGEQIISHYQARPVIINDPEVSQIIQELLENSKAVSEKDNQELLKEARTRMAKRIFRHYVKYDILCLQEADYLDPSLFPEHYRVLFAHASHSLNGIAWNRERFELVENMGDIIGRAFCIKLRHKESGKTVLVASAHLSGCNPFQTETHPSTGLIDSAKGDAEINTILQTMEKHPAELKVIGMDSNVTALHPRLKTIQEAGYVLDYENHLEPTCTNPYHVLNTRIDWIAFKKSSAMTASIVNIPVLNVGLNSIETNISDHKPIAAKINY